MSASTRKKKMSASMECHLFKMSKNTLTFLYLSFALPDYANARTPPIRLIAYFMHSKFPTTQMMYKQLELGWL